MAARFASLRTKPTLRLAFKGLIFALLVLFVYEYPGSILAAVVFVAAAVILYLKPRLNFFKFAASFVVLILAPFILPPLFVGPVVTAASLGALFVLVTGVKNLILLRRDKWYAIAHAVILAIPGAAILSAEPSFFAEVGVFILFFLLFREFYRVMSTLQGPRLALVSALQSFVALQLLGVLYLLPIGFGASTMLFALALTIFSDIFLHHISGHLSRRLILRDSTIFIFVVFVILASANWGLA